MTQISTRPYQEACVKAMIRSMHAGITNGLVVLPTGAGKTIIFSQFISRVHELYGAKRGGRIRICILAHREKLVSQARDKLLSVWPESAAKIGLACASASSDIDIDADIVIGSIQTISARLRRNTIKPFDLVLIDEAHRIPPANQHSAYNDFLDLTLALSPRRKFFAFTATPYRLGHGYIYGDRKKEGNDNWFGDPVFQIGMDDLIEQGYLAPYRIKRAVDIGPELRSVPIVNGDYKADALGVIMCRFANAAANAFLEYGEDRQHVAAFCSSIDHAEQVAEAFRNRGINSLSLHSLLPMKEREKRLVMFHDGSIQVLASVDALAEGWDESIVDCALLLRPTKAPMVYVQQCGRALRLHEGKKDALILDMADHLATHGFFSDPIVRVPKKKEAGEPMLKICPGPAGDGTIPCGMALPLGVMKCPECGYVFPRKTYEEPDRIEMRETESSIAGGARIASLPVIGVHAELARDTGYGKSVRLEIDYASITGLPRSLSLFFPAWKLGRPQWSEEWATFSKDAPPKSIDNLLVKINSSQWPKEAWISENGYKSVFHGWNAEGWPERYKKPSYAEKIEQTTRKGRVCASTPISRRLCAAKV